MSQLEIIVKESGLEGSKAAFILESFQSYFALAAEWEAKAKTLQVTRPDQKAEMALAREGRLFLREKRIAIESSRKKLKEDVLREGKAIDGIANVLKALIEPIEEYLDRQEHFVELEEKRIADARRAEIEKRIADEDAAKSKAEAEERERLRAENERLAKENAEKDRFAAEERQRAVDALAEERAKAKAIQDKADADKRAAEEKAKAERAKAEAAKRKADEAAEKKLEAERAERRRLEEALKRQIECPFCHKSFDPQAVHA